MASKIRFGIIGTGGIANAHATGLKALADDAEIVSCCDVVPGRAEDFARRWEVEAWLSLGATPTQAHEEIGHESVRESLLPTLDQTKSTGLVTLPGAFVGALFGGASPAVAAQFQLVVLAGIALTMTITGIVVTRLVGRTPYVTAGSG